jgi:type I restriction enzyme, S subunit
VIADLPPYREYRDSGVSWLGEVPEHWDVRRNKLLLREVDERSEHGSEDLLSVSQYTGVTRRRERQAGAGGLLTNAASLVGYKRVMPGDLVMNIMLAWNGSLGASAVEGIVSPAYCVFRATAGVEPRFFHYLLRTPLLTGVFKTVSTGVVDSRLRLYPDVFFRLPTVLPPLHEQAAIVRFLDHADRRIRRYIAGKKKLIALLNEQKQAIIHRAVTRGLDPSVRLKPSGVEWLGAVPEHWEVMLNQRIFKEQIRPHGGHPEVQLSLSQRDGLVATSDMQERSLQTSTFENWKVTLPGDLVLNRFKAHLGVFFASTLRGIVSFHYGVFAPRRPIVTKYFELLYHTNPYRVMFAVRSNGVTVGLQNLSNQNFYNVRSVVPPVEEQAEIVSFALGTTERLSDAMGILRREIDLLREYRTRLVADVVTGKVDVRGAAARLPTESDEPAPLEDIDAVADDDESGDADLDAVLEQAEA